MRGWEDEVLMESQAIQWRLLLLSSWGRNICQSQDTAFNDGNLDRVLVENNLSSIQTQQFSMTVQQTYVLRQSQRHSDMKSQYRTA